MKSWGGVGWGLRGWSGRCEGYELGLRVDNLQTFLTILLLGLVAGVGWGWVGGS